MPTEWELEIARAEAMVAEGEEQISRVRRVIEELEKWDRGTWEAEGLLLQLEISQAANVARLKKLRRDCKD